MLEGCKIIGLSITAAVLYGIIHDNMTARVCVEYFTKFHIAVSFAGSSPTRLALYWGVIATWWMGLGLGVPLAVFSRWGRPPHVGARDLVRPLACLLIAMGICSATVGLIVYGLASAGVITLFQPWAARIAPAVHAAFLADFWAHNTAYTVGFVGGVVLWGWCVRFRQRPAKSDNNVPTSVVQTLE